MIKLIQGIGIGLSSVLIICIVIYATTQQETLTPFVDLELLAGKTAVLPEDNTVTIDDLPGVVFPSNTLLIAYQRAD